MVTDGYDEPVELTATVTVTDDTMHADFTGSAGIASKGINVPLAYTAAYTVFGMSCIVASEIPKNAGSLKPLTVSAPEGTIVNAPKPAPVCSRHVIGQMLPDVVFGCLHQAIPDRVPAEGCSCLWNLNVRGRLKSDEGGAYGFSMAFTSNGGTGARPESDGLSATAYPSGVKGTPVEIAEQITPLIFWRKQYRPDSAGAGKTRGGLGQEIEVESRIGELFELLAAYDRIDHPARGRDGGGAGAPGSVSLKSGEKLAGKGFLKVPPGERLVVHTPGGGGLGDPSQRDAADILKDKQAGLIS
jgi:N-methylhydantoinase B